MATVDGTLVAASPFNRNAISSESIATLHSMGSLGNKWHGEHHHHTKHKDLTDLLSSNNTSNHFLNNTASPTLLPNAVTSLVSSHSISDDDFNRLKSMLRSTMWPVDHSIRRQLWMNILTLARVTTLSTSDNKKKQHTPSSSPAVHQNQTVHNNNYLTLGAITLASTLMMDNLNEEAAIDDSRQSVGLGGKNNFAFLDLTNVCFYYLSEGQGGGKTTLQRLLLSFSLQHPDLTFCPALQPITALLLHYTNEQEVFYLMNRLLAKHWLLGETRLQWEASARVFKKLLRFYYKSTADAVEVRFKDTKSFYSDWFWWIFRYLPFPYLVKVMDCYFLEGPKILYRISMALVHFYIKAVSKSEQQQPQQQQQGKEQTMADYCQHISVTVEHLLNTAFHIRNLKRRLIEHYLEQEEKILRTSGYTNSSTNGSPSTALTNVQPYVSVTNNAHHLHRIPKNSVLDSQQFLTLWSWLPARISLSQPELLFTTQEHGFRLQTMLEKVDQAEYSIVVVKSSNGELFGAFCAGLWAERHSKTYFGCGESFLFTLSPNAIKYPWVGHNKQQSDQQEQLKRELFIYVDNQKLVIGGGNGDGLCVDQSLCEGHTNRCETFDNEPLCSSSSSFFTVSLLEVIGFDSSAS